MLFRRKIPFLLIMLTLLLACSYATIHSDSVGRVEKVSTPLPIRTELITVRKEHAATVEQFRAEGKLVSSKREKEQQELPLILKEKNAKNAGTVYLTFDDGPSPITEQVLDILLERDIKATFFVLGKQVKRYPEIAKRIVEEGHSIGNHSYNHVYDELYSHFSAFSDQVTATTEEIWQTTGQFTSLLRAPGGTYRNFDETYFKAMDEAGYTIFDWNVDSGDSKSRDISSQQIFKNIQASKLKPLLIVLMHDSSIHKESVTALPAIIQYYDELNYSFASLTEESPPMVSKLAPTLKWDRTVGKQKEIDKFVNETARIKDLAQRRDQLLASYGPVKE